MENNKVILFTPQTRIQLLEEMNQAQYVAIKLLIKELDEARDKLSHVESMLKSLRGLDLNIDK